MGRIKFTSRFAVKSEGWKDSGLNSGLIYCISERVLLSHSPIGKGNYPLFEIFNSLVHKFYMPEDLFKAAALCENNLYS